MVEITIKPSHHKKFGHFVQEMRLVSGEISNTDVHWVGGYASLDPVITAFTVTFWDDNGGKPGSVFARTIYPGDAGGTPLNSLYDYSVDLPASLLANAGTQCRFSIVADIDLRKGAWVWANGSPGDGGSYQDSHGSRNKYSTDLAFDLTGTVVNPKIPEPATMLLLGSG